MQATGISTSGDSRDSFYTSLDKMMMPAAGALWRLDVFSVVDTGDAKWIQATCTGTEAHNLLLRVHPAAGPRDAVVAVKNWLERPTEVRDRIVDVRPPLVDAA